MSDDVEKLPRDYRRTLRVAAFLAALAGPPFFYVHAIERRLSTHLAEVEATRPQMFDFACSTARNVYRLCLRNGVECDPIPATCRK